MVKKKITKKKSYHKKPEEILMSNEMKMKYMNYAKHSQSVFNSITLVVVSLASVLTTIVTLPFLIFFNSYLMYAFILMIGVVFGFIFSFMVSDLKHIEKEGHLLMSLIVPIIAVLNIAVMVYMLRHLVNRFDIPFVHDPIILSALYLLGYVIPYLFFSLLGYVKQRRL